MMTEAEKLAKHALEMVLANMTNPNVYDERKVASAVVRACRALGTREDDLDTAAIVLLKAVVRGAS